MKQSRKEIIRFTLEDISKEIAIVTDLSHKTILRILKFYVAQMWTDITYGNKVSIFRNWNIFMEMVHKSDYPVERVKSWYNENYPGYKLRLYFCDYKLLNHGYTYHPQLRRMKAMRLGIKLSKLFEKEYDKLSINKTSNN